MRPIAISNRIASIEAARLHVAGFLSRRLQPLCMEATPANRHLCMARPSEKTTFRGNLNFAGLNSMTCCDTRMDTDERVSPSRIRRYQAA